MSPHTEVDTGPNSAGAEPAELTTDARPAGRRRDGFWVELSGALAVGLSALAAVVVVFQILAWAQGTPGPGLPTVAGHLGAAALAVLVQRIADRTKGRLAVLGVLAVTGATLWSFWWA